MQPGADLGRLEEMINTQLDELWGSFLGQMRQSDLTGPAAKAFFEKYEGLLRATPFQFQTEMLFAMRAMGMLSGITTASTLSSIPGTKRRPSHCDSFKRTSPRPSEVRSRTWSPAV